MAFFRQLPVAGVRWLDTKRERAPVNQPASEKAVRQTVKEKEREAQMMLQLDHFHLVDVNSVCVSVRPIAM